MAAVLPYCRGIVLLCMVPFCGEVRPSCRSGVAFSCVAGYDMVRNHMRCFEGKPIDEMGAVESQYIARRYQEYVMK